MRRRSSTQGFSLPYVLLLLAVLMSILITSTYLLVNEYRVYELKRESYEMYLMKEAAISHVLFRIESEDVPGNEYLTFGAGIIGLYYTDRPTYCRVYIDLYGENNDAWFTLFYDKQTKTYTIE